MHSNRSIFIHFPVPARTLDRQTASAPILSLTLVRGKDQDDVGHSPPGI